MIKFAAISVSLIAMIISCGAMTNVTKTFIITYVQYKCYTFIDILNVIMPSLVSVSFTINECSYAYYDMLYVVM